MSKPTTITKSVASMRDFRTRDDMQIPKDNAALAFIDLIMPEHGYTSCSDENTCNGFYSYDGVDWLPRCTRCAYLELISGWRPEGFDPERWQQ